MERRPQQLPEGVLHQPPAELSNVSPGGDGEQISQADAVARLGQAATASAGIVVGPGHDDHDEPDTYPWDDAAHWSPAEVVEPATQLQERHCTREELDELFGEQPDEQVGSVDELPWYGLVRHGNRPGGLLFREDTYGFRSVHEADTDEALNQTWVGIQQEYGQFYEERDAYERVTADADRADFDGPRIWVGSLADYVAGRLYGVWMDATGKPDDLHAATRFMLRGSREQGAEEFGIFDHEGFKGYRVGEYQSLATVSRIANGIAEHGEAFAAWVNCVGDRDEDLLTDESFQDHYLGHFDSMEGYVEHLLDECGDYRYLDDLPEHLKPYVKIDVEMMARDYETELYVVEASEDGVLVFDMRC